MKGLIEKLGSGDKGDEEGKSEECPKGKCDSEESVDEGSTTTTEEGGWSRTESYFTPPPTTTSPTPETSSSTPQSQPIGSINPQPQPQQQPIPTSPSPSGIPITTMAIPPSITTTKNSSNSSLSSCPMGVTPIVSETHGPSSYDLSEYNSSAAAMGKLTIKKIHADTKQLIPNLVYAISSDLSNNIYSVVVRDNDMMDTNRVYGIVTLRNVPFSTYNISEIVNCSIISPNPMISHETRISVNHKCGREG